MEVARRRQCCVPFAAGAVCAALLLAPLRSGRAAPPLVPSAPPPSPVPSAPPRPPPPAPAAPPPDSASPAPAAFSVDFLSHLTKTSATCPSVMRIPRQPPWPPVASLSRIHRGIYRAVLEDGTAVAFKAACRPPTAMHGQQGWSEVAYHHLAKLMSADPMSPCATGAAFTLNQTQWADDVDYEKAWRSDACGRDAADRRVMYGVAMGWVPHGLSTVTHQEDLAQQWVRAETPVLTAGNRSLVREIVAVLATDYVGLNTDRRFKNWAKMDAPKGSVRRTRVVAIDNGFAFGGPLAPFVAVCDEAEDWVKCPGFLHYSARFIDPDKKKRKPCLGGNLRFCLFSREQRTRWRAVSAQWSGTLSSAFARQLAADPLLTWLAEAHAGWNTTAPGISRRGRWSVPLARFADWCPGAEAAAHPSALKLAEWVALGIGVRLRRLVRHVDECIEEFGEEYVLQL